MAAGDNSIAFAGWCDGHGGTVGSRMEVGGDNKPKFSMDGRAKR